MHAADLDDGLLRLELAAGQLVGLHDVHAPLHAVHGLNLLHAFGRHLADGADDVALHAPGLVNSETERPQPILDSFQIFLARRCCA